MKLVSPTAVRAQKRLLAGLALIVAIAVVVVIVVLTRSPSNSGQPAADTTSGGAATVQRRNLVETDTESGTLSYAGSQTIYNRLTGTTTWLPSVGQVIHPGQQLFSIDNQPVILMNGSTPAYRDLSAADVQGPDVLELNRNLIALGFDPYGIVDDDVWQPATTAGVEQFQASLSETETGVLTLGQVVFLPGAQLISTVDGTVGSTGAGGGATTGTSYELTGGHTQFVSLTTTQTTTTGTGTTTTGTGPTTTGHHHKISFHRGKHHHKRTTSLAALVALLKAEVQELKHQNQSPGPSSNSSKPSSSSTKPSSKSPSSSSGTTPSASSNSNSGGSTATEILQSSSTHLVVTVDLAASSQNEAVRGEHVTVEMPNNRIVDGVISAVSPVAQASSSGSGNSGAGAGAGASSPNSGNGSSSSTIPVTIRLLGHVSGAGLDQASVSVNFAEAKAKNVLSVPVTALVATAGGNYAVQEAAAPHKLIQVTTGLFAAGYVEISGSGIYQGLQVTDSQG
jgi:peptidoglycan hydrolase-like protein with peptidoglycan-binding domain